MGSSFGDTLAARVAERESQVVLGLDPDPEALWPGVHDAEGAKAAERSPTWRTAVATRVHCCALIDAAGLACVAVKPQLACFERLGAPGWEALEAVVEHASQRGLLVIADGKRGDVPVTARAYAQSLFERLGADLATVNPLLGGDAIEPFVTGARAAGAGVLLLVRTSNPGAADVQDLDSRRAIGDRPIGGTGTQSGGLGPGRLGRPARCGNASPSSWGSWARSAWGSPRASATWARWWGPPSPGIWRGRAS